MLYYQIPVTPEEEEAFENIIKLKKFNGNPSDQCLLGDNIKISSNSIHNPQVRNDESSIA